MTTADAPDPVQSVLDEVAKGRRVRRVIVAIGEAEKLLAHPIARVCIGAQVVETALMNPGEACACFDDEPGPLSLVID